MIVEVVEGSSTVQVVEEAAAAEVVIMTTVAVVETEAAEVAAETSAQGGGSSIHCAGKEIAADVPPGPQREAVVAEEEEGEELDFFTHPFGFFSPATVVGSRAFRSRDRVPHPEDIPNRGIVFDDERLEKVWWDRVEEIDELKNPTGVVSSFARMSMNVSACRPVFSYVVFFLLLTVFSLS